MSLPAVKQLGFAPVIIILIVAIVIIAVRAGYYFYKISQEQKEVETQLRSEHYCVLQE